MAAKRAEETARCKRIIRGVAEPVRKQVVSGAPNHFSLPFLNNMEIVEAEQNSPSTSRIVYRFPVVPEYLNPAGGIHGGAVATIFDITTSWLLFLIGRPGFWERTGTTRTLNCSYLRPAAGGQIIRLEAEVVHAGRRLAFLKGIMMRESDGAKIAACEHHKYNVEGESKV